jgi:hypothetical protein
VTANETLAVLIPVLIQGVNGLSTDRIIKQLGIPKEVVFKTGRDYPDQVKSIRAMPKESTMVEYGVFHERKQKNYSEVILTY